MLLFVVNWMRRWLSRVISTRPVCTPVKVPTRPCKPDKPSLTFSVPALEMFNIVKLSVMTNEGATSTDHEHSRFWKYGTIPCWMTADKSVALELLVPLLLVPFPAAAASLGNNVTLVVVGGHSPKTPKATVIVNPLPSARSLLLVQINITDEPVDS